MNFNGKNRGKGASIHSKDSKYFSIQRRDFIKFIGFGGAALSFYPLFAQEDYRAAFERIIPADKKLSSQWVKSLFERGQREVYTYPESEKIGMPVGGICCGQVYLGGNGKLWHWDIFNSVENSGSSGPHYANPLKPHSPIDQGFAIAISSTEGSQIRPLDHTGWEKVSFIGEYPIGYIEYEDRGCPVTVSLEAFSPFIPLNPEDSALPATVMRFTVKNRSRTPVEIEIGGWLQNAVCINSASEYDGVRRNRIVDHSRFKFLECTAERKPAETTQKREDIVFENFESGSYSTWTVSGTAFGTEPIEVSKIPSYQGDVGATGKRLANSHASAPGKSVEEKDSHTGWLLSKPFTIERNYINFLIGGGSHKGRTCVNLIIDGKTVLSATGKNDNRMRPVSWNVRQWLGKKAQIQILDMAHESWGNVGVDHIVFTDEPGALAARMEQAADYGSMGIALLKTGVGKNGKGQFYGCAQLPARNIPAGLFPLADKKQPQEATAPFDKNLVGSLTCKFTLKPDQTDEAIFIIVWYFPNIKLDLPDTQGRHYGKRFKNAYAVAEYIVSNFERLSQQTRLWHDTWYDSTLPYWFLDRTFATVSHLATNTCYWFGNGRFYAWEGVGCCPGTCTHVWHYAQAMARLFPQLERVLREKVDFGVAFDPTTGRIRFRAEHNNHWAVDGQAGVVLRTYREHLMSADNQFLQRNYSKCKKAIEFLIQRDENTDGIIDGPQHNTLDTDWFGKIAWLSSMYLAALRAGELMALEMDDKEFAQKCRSIFEKGRAFIEQKLFNGEYFINLVDKNRLDTINSGTGCHIDQVLGDSWAEQINLGPILDPLKVKSALKALWRYNYCPDVGQWRNVNKPGRWYAMPGEAGLLMCTFPQPDWDYSKAKGKGPGWAAGYFNECMTGFEYQVAWHSISKGLVMEGLAITRSIHDRYHPSKRNPWNEIECGDHYARAMASYGVFLAVCGFKYHGPKGIIGFKPKLTPENSKSAFTTATGWGSFSQQLGERGNSAILALRWGTLTVNCVELGLREGFKPSTVSATLGKKNVPLQFKIQQDTLIIKFEKPLQIKEGESLQIVYT